MNIILLEKGNPFKTEKFCVDNKMDYEETRYGWVLPF